MKPQNMKNCLFIKIELKLKQRPFENMQGKQILQKFLENDPSGTRICYHFLSMILPTYSICCSRVEDVIVVFFACHHICVIVYDCTSFYNLTKSCQSSQIRFHSIGQRWAVARSVNQVAHKQ